MGKCTYWDFVFCWPGQHLSQCLGQSTTFSVNFERGGDEGRCFKDPCFYCCIQLFKLLCCGGGHNCLCCGCQGLSLYMGHWFRSEQCRFPIGQPLTCGKQLIMREENSVLFKTIQCPIDQPCCCWQASSCCGNLSVVLKNVQFPIGQPLICAKQVLFF